MSMHQLFIYISLHLSALCTIAVMSAVTIAMSDCKAAIVNVLKSYYPLIDRALASIHSNQLLLNRESNLEWNRASRSTIPVCLGITTVANSISLQLPDRLYQRLVNTAQATQQPLEAIILRALEVGSPPDWDDVPEPFQADLAALDRLDDAALWTIALGRQSETQFTRYDELLDRNREARLTDAEQVELAHLRTQADRFMLRKAQARALLRWRGHHVPHA